MRKPSAEIVKRLFHNFSNIENKNFTEYMAFITSKQNKIVYNSPALFI